MKPSKDQVHAFLGSVLITAFVVLAALGLKDSRIECAAEDELPMTLTEDSFDYEAGDQFCIHIDQLSQ